MPTFTDASLIAAGTGALLRAIALLGSWLVTRLPRRASLAAVTSAAVAAAMFGLGAWSFAVIRQSPFRGAHTAHSPLPMSEGYRGTRALRLTPPGQHRHATGSAAAPSSPGLALPGLARVP